MMNAHARTIPLLNFRLGFATNSSSTHSVLLRKDGVLLDEVPPESSGAFGWDDFILTTRHSKRVYLGTLVRDSIRGAGASSPIAQQLAENLMELPTGALKDTYVDHQSNTLLPIDPEGRLDLRFLRSYQRFIDRNDVAIAGGNDNVEGLRFSERLVAEGVGDEAQSLPFRDDNSPLWSRFDESSSTWTLFNVNNGTKARLSIDGARGPQYLKGLKRVAKPELVDMKLTDYCSFGCKYCYQGSTKKGKHGDVQTIFHLLEALQNLEVFEVAFGGGEPTQHPNFVDILEQARERRMVPNFTTFTLDWTRDEKTRRRIFDAIGGFALSVTDAKDIEPLVRVRDMWKAHSGQQRAYDGVSTQLVMGSQSLKDLVRIAEACAEAGVRCTLLGFKRTGRGIKYPKHDYRGWEKLFPFGSISIDTALAAETDLSDFHDWSYHVEEGAFSMYIDAVEMKAGPSSFCEPESMRPIDNAPLFLEQRIAQVFQAESP